MGFLHNLTLQLKNETPKAEVAAFLEQLPEDAHISTVVRTTPKDRPWESEKTTVELVARWTREPARPTPAKRTAPPPSPPVKRDRW